jgi:tetratricopeptide (TPR) repeat protein
MDGHRFGELRSTIDSADFLAVDDQMRAFVRSSIAEKQSKSRKLRQLFHALFRAREQSITYDAENTGTASQTFHLRSGNCLSTTAMFVALAREAGLNASFQEIRQRPVLRVDGSLWIYEKHVNAIVDVGRGVKFTIDFDRREGGEETGRPIHDSVATAQFFSNLGINAMGRGDSAAAHANLLRAIELDPGLPYVWNNLGVLYRRAGFLHQAEEIFRYTISLDPRELTAMSNLANLLRSADRVLEAEQYEDKLEHERRRNPYHLFNLANQAYEELKFDESIAYLRRAIRLKGDEPRFHQLLREVQSQQAMSSPGEE